MWENVTFACAKKKSLLDSISSLGLCLTCSKTLKASFLGKLGHRSDITNRNLLMPYANNRGVDQPAHSHKHLSSLLPS